MICFRNIPESIPINPQPPLERCANTVVKSNSARQTVMPTTKPGQITGSAQITNGPISALQSPMLSHINQLPDSTSTVSL